MGDYVLVHVGFALSRIDEAEAQEVFRILEEMGEAGEVGEPEGSAPAGADPTP